jgi:tetrahydromethanopterin S-methyltransferase subunit B
MRKIFYFTLIFLLFFSNIQAKRLHEYTTQEVMNGVFDYSGLYLNVIDSTNSVKLDTVNINLGSLDSLMIANNDSLGLMIIDNDTIIIRLQSIRDTLTLFKNSYRDSTALVHQTIKDSTGAVNQTLKDSLSLTISRIFNTNAYLDSLLNVNRDSLNQISTDITTFEQTFKDSISIHKDVLRDSTGAINQTLKDSLSLVVSRIFDTNTYIDSLLNVNRDSLSQISTDVTTFEQTFKDSINLQIVTIRDSLNAVATELRSLNAGQFSNNDTVFVDSIINPQGYDSALDLWKTQEQSGLESQYTAPQELVSTQDVGDVADTWKDVDEVSTQGYNKIFFYIEYTANNSTGAQIQILPRRATSGTNFVLENSSDYQKTIGDSDTNICYVFETDNLMPYIYVQTKATVLGATTGTIQIYYSLAY